jgi:hypothetical protein
MSRRRTPLFHGKDAMSAPRKKDGLFAAMNHVSHAMPPRPSLVFGISVYRRGASATGNLRAQADADANGKDTSEGRAVSPK